MQNSKKEDCLTIIRLFYNRIAAWGRDPVLVKTIFIDAAKSLDAMVHIHTYSRQSPRARQSYRRAHKVGTDNFADVGGLDIQQLTVAFSRPPNLRDHLTRGRLHQAQGREVSTHLLPPTPSTTNVGGDDLRD